MDNRAQKQINQVVIEVLYVQFGSTTPMLACHVMVFQSLATSSSGFFETFFLGGIRPYSNRKAWSIFMVGDSASAAVPPVSIHETVG